MKTRCALSDFLVVTYEMVIESGDGEFDFHDTSSGKF